MNQTIKTDLRNLRFDEAGNYAVETIASAKHREEKGTLCDRCASKFECSTLRYMKRAAKRGQSAVVTACNEFAPAIKFVDITGTDRKAFNTFRLGTAWFHRVKPNQVVALVDADESLYGYATVATVWKEHRGAALARHAAMIHLMIGRVDPESAPERLGKILRNLYGKIATESNPYMTVIDLKRL